MSELAVVLSDIVDQVAAAPDRGYVANYIPELASVDPKQFGVAVALPCGQVESAGDASTAFSIQSISKVFTLAIALGRHGEELWLRVGREPSGLAFNSIVQLEQERGRPRNPFINAGAIVVTDAILAGHQPRDFLAELLQFIRSATGSGDIHINKAIARSESKTGHRNRALAHMLKAQGNLQSEPEFVLGAYFHQCAIDMNCEQLARAGRFLAGLPGTALVGANSIRCINSLMMTCGHYDGSGDFAYHVGLPGKSGVGGGILVIAPGRASIAIWSPGLNAQGNSALGTMAAGVLAHRMGWSVFG